MRFLQTALAAPLILLLCGATCLAQQSTQQATSEEATGVGKDVVYLFSSFRGNGEDGLHLAIGEDGLNWSPLNEDKPLLKPQVGGRLMRDPCLILGPDDRFHMVWTTSWTDDGIGVAHSQDLLTWSEQQYVPVMQHEPTARNCWAPEILWDADRQEYLIYWATTIPGRFPKTASKEDDGYNHRIYCTTTKDFETYTPTRLFYDPGFNVIDSTIVRFEDHYVMVLKDETRQPAAKNLRIATSHQLAGPWQTAAKPFSPDGLWVEGPTVAKVGKHWYVYYDAYAQHHYGAMRTEDFQTWENVTSQLNVPPGTRHGTVLAVPRAAVVKLYGRTSWPEPSQ